MPSARPSATATIITSSTNELWPPFFGVLLATGSVPCAGRCLARLVFAGLLGRLFGSLVARGLGIGRRRLLGGSGLLSQLLLAGARRVVRRHRALLDKPGLDDLLGPCPAPLADARGAAHAVAQIVELRSTDVAARGDLDALYLGRVDRERPLHTDAERLLADREGLAHAVALALDHDALEHLRPPARALHNLEMHAHAVARLEGGNAAQLCALDAVDD